MSVAFKGFSHRLKRIETDRENARKHGWVRRIREDGLIVLVPLKRRRSVPMRGVILVALALYAFKVTMYQMLGAQTYTERLAELTQGDQVERIGAYIMQVDPFMSWIVSQIAIYL